MAGYIRQSTFVDGDTITAALFNNEYNQLVNAFSNTSGHKHDGTTAEGPVIGLIGDAGETSPNNKVLIDTTNNYIEFYVEVSSAPVQQLYIADGAIIPVTDSDIDLGTTSLRFKDTYTDTVTTTGNVSIGGDLTVTGSATISGNLTFGDADTDSINLAAEIDSDIIPNTDGTYDLGSATKEWQDLYIDGTANIDSLVADTADINGGTIDGATIATSDITVGAGKTLNVSAGTLTLADDQISGDKVEGGTIAATTITTLTSTTGNITNVNATTVDSTNLEVTNLKAKDGTAAGSIADSTGVVTLASSVLTTTDINGGTIDGVTIGGSSAGAVTFTDLSDGTITIAGFADEDNMVSDSATLLPTQQSVKAYVDSQVTAQDLDFQGDTGGALSIDLDSESLTIAGGTGIDTSGATNTLTVAIDSTVTTLTGTQTLTNKTLTSPDVNTPDIDGGTIDNSVIGGTTPAAGTFTTLTANSGITGTLQTAAQTNITSVGTLSSLSVGSTLTIDNTASSSFGTIEISGTSGAYIDLKSPSSDDFDLRIITSGTGGQINAASGTIALQIAGSTVLSTASGGVAVTGTLSATGNITGTLATAAQPNITSVGTLTTLTVDDITINGSTISDAGDLTVDVGGDLTLDTDGGDIFFADAGTTYGKFSNASSSLQIKSEVSDADIIFKGNDGGVPITALTLDMSDAGTAIFNSGATFGGAVTTNGITTTGNLVIGTEDNNAAIFEISGGAAGSTEGGEIRLDTAADHDGTYEFYRIDVNQDDFRIGRQGNTDFYIFQDGKVKVENVFEVGGVSNLSSVDASAGISSTALMNVKADGTNDTVINVGLNTASNHYSYIDLIGDSTYTDYGLRIIRNNGGANTSSGIHHRGTGELFFRTDDAAAIKFETNASEAMRIDSSGNVGIGTTSPTHKLHVQGTSNDTIDETKGTMKVQASGGNGMIFGTIASSPYTSYIQSAYVQDTSLAQYNLALNPIGGNVGIGTTSPTSKLDVSGVITSKADAALNDAQIGRLNFTNTNSNASANPIRASILSGRQNSAWGGYLSLYTSTGTSAASEKVRITETGNVGIGTTSPSTKLDVVGSGKFQPAIAGGDALVTIAQTNANAYVHAGVKINAGNTNPFYIYQSGSSNTLRFNYNSLSDAGGQMVITDDGNVGIGTGIPDYLLEAYNGDISSLKLTSAAGGNAVNALRFRVRNSGNTSQYATLGTVSAETVSSWGGVLTFSTKPASGSPDESTTERMRIDSDGNVITGSTTANASDAVTLRQDGTAHINNVQVANGGGSVGGTTPSIYSPASATLAVSTNSTERMRIDGSGHVVIQDDAVYTTNAPTHRGSLILAGASGGTSFGGIEFHTNAGGGAGYGTKICASDAEQTFLRRNNSSSWTETMRLDSDGTLCVGITGPLSSTETAASFRTDSAGAPALDVSKISGNTTSANVFIRFHASSGGTSMGAIAGNGAGNAQFIAVSDERLKENINPLSGSLDKVLALNPVSYDWKKNGEHIEAGFVAQEVEEILPEYVTTEENEEQTKGLTGGMTAGYIAVLTKAIQEQQAQIEALQSEINKLKGE